MRTQAFRQLVFGTMLLLIGSVLLLGVLILPNVSTSEDTSASPAVVRTVADCEGICRNSRR
jgi:hypothetical protein